MARRGLRTHAICTTCTTSYRRRINPLPRARFWPGAWFPPWLVHVVVGSAVAVSVIWTSPLASAPLLFSTSPWSVSSRLVAEPILGDVPTLIGRGTYGCEYGACPTSLSVARGNGRRQFRDPPIVAASLAVGA